MTSSSRLTIVSSPITVLTEMSRSPAAILTPPVHAAKPLARPVPRAARNLPLEAARKPSAGGSVHEMNTATHNAPLKRSMEAHERCVPAPELKKS
jgi:hypothetical protein